MSDDHAYQAISAYQGPFAEVAPTPNIDRIFHNGMRFDRCLVTNSICGPSRAVILTGKYSHLNGIARNDRTPFDGSQNTFPKLLNQSGYHTAIIGKWHLGSNPTGFDYWDILPDQGHYYNPDFVNERGVYQESGYVTEIITRKALEWLKGKTLSPDPFMLMIHHKAPHREWEPAPKYIERFRGVKFPEPASLFDDYQGRGRAAKEQDMSIGESMRIESDLKMWGDTLNHLYRNTYARMDPIQRREWDRTFDSIKTQFRNENPQGDNLLRWKYQRYICDYLACVQSVDESVGAIMDFLEANNLDKNTVVVYTSDQGFYLGEHGWFDKRFMYEESLRTPLLISWPAVIPPSSINNSLVSNLDFAETFLEVASIPVPPDMQGVSMVPLFENHTPQQWRKAHFYHYTEFPAVHKVKKHYGVTTATYKLIHFYDDIDEWELYDLDKDPYEMKNVYNEHQYVTVRDSLHNLLVDVAAYYGDQKAYDMALKAYR